MTFVDMVSEVADRLNLTSAQALTRIGRSINECYKNVCSSVGLQTSVRTVVTTATTIGVQSLTFEGVTKLFAVFDPSSTPPRVLNERTFDYLRNRALGVDPPAEYAIQRMGSSSVTIYLDCVPTTSYALGADAEVSTTTLSGVAVPAFNSDFHDLLVYYAESIEYDKLEKPDLAAKQEDKYEKRLSQLRFFIAKSAYLDIVQGIRGEPSQNRLV